ncbi:MAG TPA: Crp/Fnr family transcriptional regulator [Acidiferrobacteraceae bacterium]|nr:Crp/Fnr family transcriptional regulator [Acidiferrobacteraceae bacterium]
MPINQQLNALKDVPIFKNLPHEELKKIASKIVLRTYSKRATVLNEGDAADYLYIVVSGKVKVYVIGDQGKEAIVNIMGPGESFGELALIDQQPRSASVAALEPIKLATLPRQAFHDCLLRNPQIAIDLMRSMSRHIRELTDSVRDLVFLDVYGRVAKLLNNMAERRDDKLLIEKKLTNQDIANAAGASREMICRVMRDLTAGGYISMHEQAITIEKPLPVDE